MLGAAGLAIAPDGRDVYCLPGDLVENEIERIGVLRNPIALRVPLAARGMKPAPRSRR
jgi:hypothetical protein